MIKQWNSTIDNDEKIPEICTFVNRYGHRKLTAEVLSDKWEIGTDRSKENLSVTTQNGIISAIFPSSRSYHSGQMYIVNKFHGKFDTDTFNPIQGLSLATSVLKFIHIKLGVAFDTPSLIQNGRQLDAHLSILYMTLELHNISYLMMTKYKR